MLSTKVLQTDSTVQTVQSGGTEQVRSTTHTHCQLSSQLRPVRPLQSNACTAVALIPSSLVVVANLLAAGAGWSQPPRRTNQSPLPSPPCLHRLFSSFLDHLTFLPSSPSFASRSLLAQSWLVSPVLSVGAHHDLDGTVFASTDKFVPLGSSAIGSPIGRPPTPSVRPSVRPSVPDHVLRPVLFLPDRANSARLPSLAVHGHRQRDPVGAHKVMRL